MTLQGKLSKLVSFEHVQEIDKVNLSHTKDDLLFEVCVDGKWYRIYTTGYIEGFEGEKVWIVNHFLVRVSEMTI